MNARAKIGLVGGVFTVLGLVYVYHDTAKHEQRHDASFIRVVSDMFSSQSIAQKDNSGGEKEQPADIVRYVDERLSNVHSTDSPSEMADVLCTNGYTTQHFARDVRMHDHWSNMVSKFAITGSTLKDFSVIHEGVVTDNPNMYYIRVDEKDLYQFKHQNQQIVHQLADWELVRDDSESSWKVNSINVISSHVEQ